MEREFMACLLLKNTAVETACEDYLYDRYEGLGALWCLCYIWQFYNNIFDFRFSMNEIVI